MRRMPESYRLKIWARRGSVGTVSKMAGLVGFREKHVIASRMISSRCLSSVRKPSRRPRVRSMSDVTVPPARNSRIGQGAAIPLHCCVGSDTSLGDDEVGSSASSVPSGHPAERALRPEFEAPPTSSSPMFGAALSAYATRARSFASASVKTFATRAGSSTLDELQ